MANIFAVTTTSTENLIAAEVNGAAKASVIYTVTNTSPKPVRGIARVQVLDQTQIDWVSVEGDPEKDFASGATAQFVVNFSKPLRVLEAGEVDPVEQYPFRLTVVSAVRPDEDFTEGPKIIVTTPAREGKKKDGGGGIPWWIFLIIGLVVLALIAGVVLGVRSCNKPVVTPPPAPTPTPTPVPTPDTRVPALLFEHADFNGRSQRFNAGTFRVDLNQFGNVGNDMASSLIVAQGYRVRICEHADASGVCDEYGEGVYNVLQHNDSASYIKVWLVE